PQITKWIFSSLSYGLLYIIQFFDIIDPSPFSGPLGPKDEILSVETHQVHIVPVNVPTGTVDEFHSLPIGHGQVKGHHYRSDLIEVGDTPVQDPSIDLLHMTDLF